MSSILSAPHFHDEAAAYAHVEARVWPKGRVCPHCGVVDRSGPLQGKSNRIGLYKCYACRRPFTVKVGTIFEDSHISLHVWLQAMYLMASSKKGISSNQLHRTLGITLKSAWFLSHRIREAMAAPHIDGHEPIGGEGKTVEIDEAYIGGLEKNKHRNKRKHAGGGGKGKEAVFALVERGGSVRSYHVPTVNAKTLAPILRGQMKKGSSLMSDESVTAMALGQEFGNHQAVNHSVGEYVRGDAHTNTVEGYFSILKRGITGVYHSVSEQHLHRYLAEFDFRYSNRMALGVEDQERAEKIVTSIIGKRLTYRTTRSAAL
jgi:transposase-like protein